jgi:hypothetical protein
MIKKHIAYYEEIIQCPNKKLIKDVNHRAIRYANIRAEWSQLFMERKRLCKVSL